MKYILLLFLSIGITALAFFNKGYKNKYSTEISIETNARSDEDKPVPVPLQSIDSLQHSDFVLSPDSRIPMGKNVAYTPTLLLAWDEIEKVLKSPVTLNLDNSEDLHLLQNSQGYQLSLLPGEYTTKTTIKEGEIRAEAYFEKNLPFTYAYLPNRNTLFFRNTPVRGFGKPAGEYANPDRTKIRYYESDEKFIVVLLPADSSHEIVLCKGIKLSGIFRDMIRETDSLIKAGKQAAQSKNNAWKYKLKEPDELAVPDIHFNFNKNYPMLVDQVFSANNKPYSITKAFQETAFSLNQKGVVVASAATIDIKSVDTGGVKSGEHPKKLLLDKPFLLLLRNVKRNEPYFVLKVDNTAILKQENSELHNE